MGEKCSDKFRLRIRLPRNSRYLLHAANLRHGTGGFTSPPKEGVLKIFFALKNTTASAGFEPANLGTKGQHATSRPPKPIVQTTNNKFYQNSVSSFGHKTCRWDDGPTDKKQHSVHCASSYIHELIFLTINPCIL